MAGRELTGAPDVHHAKTDLMAARKSRGGAAIGSRDASGQDGFTLGSSTTAGSRRFLRFAVLADCRAGIVRVARAVKLPASLLITVPIPAASVPSPKQQLQKLKGQHLHLPYGGWGSNVRPAWPRNASMRAGRYWMRLSRFFMIAASWSTSRTARLPRLAFMAAQAPSAGFSSGA